MLLGRDAKVGLVDARVGATAVNGAVVTSSGDSHPSATRTAKRIGLVAARYPHSPFVPVPTRQGCQRQRSVSWSRSSRFAVSSRRPFGEPAAFHRVDWTHTLWRGVVPCSGIILDSESVSRAHRCHALPLCAFHYRKQDLCWRQDPKARAGPVRHPGDDTDFGGLPRPHLQRWYEAWDGVA